MRFQIEDPELWNGREDYQVAVAIIKTQTVINDLVEQVSKQNKTLFPNTKNPHYYEQVIM